MEVLFYTTAITADLSHAGLAHRYFKFLAEALSNLQAILIIN